jgi:hypothetical protein
MVGLQEWEADTYASRKAQTLRPFCAFTEQVEARLYFHLNTLMHEFKKTQDNLPKKEKKDHLRAERPQKHFTPLS